MADQGNTAERIHELIEALINLVGLKEIGYNRQDGAWIRYTCRTKTPRTTIRAAEEAKAELGLLGDQVAGAISSPHLVSCIRSSPH